MSVNKNNGDLSEMAFILEASKRGFSVSKPFGDNKRYDFILDNSKGNLFKVQIKSSHVDADEFGRHRFSCYHSDKKKYSKNDVDFICLHVAKLDLWYIIPVESLNGRRKISVYPTKPNRHGLYDAFLFDWCRFV